MKSSEGSKVEVMVKVEVKVTVEMRSRSIAIGRVSKSVDSFSVRQE